MAIIMEALKVLTIFDPPFAGPCVMALNRLKRTNRCPDLGPSVESFGYSFQSLNLNYTLIPNVANLPSGEKINETHYSGMLGELHQGRIDVVATGWFYTPNRLQDFSMSDPVVYDDNVFVLHRRTLDSGNLFTIFDFYTWICFFLSIFIATCAFTIGQFVLAHAHRIKSKKSITRRISDHQWTLLTVITDQYSGISDLIDALSVRIILSLFGLLIVFIFSLYQSTLLSTLLAKKESVIFESTEELAPLIAKGDYYLVESTDYISPYYYSHVEFSEETSFKAMKEALKVNPVRIYPRAELMKVLSSDPKAILVMSNLGMYSILNYFCHLSYQQDKDSSAMPAGFMMRKNHPFFKKLNENGKRIQQFSDWIWNKFRRQQNWEWRKKCADAIEKSKKTPGSPLSVATLRSAMFLVLLGFGISTLYFAIEFIFSKFVRNNAGKNLKVPAHRVLYFESKWVKPRKSYRKK